MEALQARFGRDATAARAEAFLSAVAKRIVFDLGVRRLIVAGGETSGAVASALGLTELSIGPYEGPGLNRALASSPARLALMFKSGKLGDEHIFERALDAMTRSLSARARRRNGHPRVLAQRCNKIDTGADDARRDAS